MFNRALRLLADLPFADSQCGLKGFRRLAARELFHEARLDWFAFEVRGCGPDGSAEPSPRSSGDRGPRSLLGEVWAVRRGLDLTRAPWGVTTAPPDSLLGRR